MCGVFAVLRMVSVLGVRISTYPDSASYFDLRLWQPFRLWTTPLVYSFGFSRDHLVALQVVVAVVAWVSAAMLIARAFRSQVAQAAATVGVLVLGLTTQVSNFDSAILSESLTLSLTVVLVALALNVVYRSSTRLMWAVGVVAFLWAFSRQSNVYILWLATSAAVLAALLHRRRGHFVVLACVLGAIALSGTVVSSSNTAIQTDNLGQVIARRIAPDATLRSWWRHQGMPVLPPGVPSAAKRDTENASDPLIYEQTQRLKDDKLFWRWLSNHGAPAYLHFLVTHPHYVLTVVFSERRLLNSFLSEGVPYGTPEQVLPSFLERVFWPETSGGALLIISASLMVCFAVIASRRRRATDVAAPPTLKSALRYSNVLLAISIAAIFFIAHTAGAEFERLLLIPAVSARIAAVIAVAALIDYTGFLKTHATTSTTPNTQNAA